MHRAVVARLEWGAAEHAFTFGQALKLPAALTRNSIGLWHGVTNDGKIFAVKQDFPCFTFRFVDDRFCQTAIPLLITLRNQNEP